MSNKTYEVVTARVLEIMERGVIPWKPCIQGNSTAAKPPVNGTTNRAYHGCNQMLLWVMQAISGYGTNRWATVKQINTLGANVRKGERGTPVIYTSAIPKKDANGKPILNKDGTQAMGQFARYSTAFNFDQTTISLESEEVIPIDPALQQGAMNDLLTAYCAREKIAMETGGAVPCYYPTKDSIRLPDFRIAQNPERWFESAFHECVHSTGHPSRLNRDGFNGVTTDKIRAREELIAELGSAFILHDFGIFDTQEENVAAYLESWSKVLKDSPSMIVQASSRAEKAITFIKGESR